MTRYGKPGRGQPFTLFSRPDLPPPPALGQGPSVFPLPNTLAAALAYKNSETILSLEIFMTIAQRTAPRSTSGIRFFSTEGKVVRKSLR
ncbi:hypothetical protein EVAR_93885_1 [Eumeta japonica]|uniref:Uncharacterized protein n=1 Tax=Eumeta variegata TaxID=151549 RepID=A0A4C1TWW5_EUMVA|nr:hypothetical protein EVAR_93885_1 [Eumeta japonica]